jgi:cytochrome c oxidase cbb3-type subunit III
MSLRFLKSTLCLATLLATIGCEREQRQFSEPASSSAPVQSVRLTPQQPGPPTPVIATDAPYAENVYALNEGKRLFSAYNCEGCHFLGGGGMGPPLMDDRWIYGSDPSNIFNTIVEGRPNGMPSFGSKIPRYQIWQLASYVRSLAGLTRPDVAPSRSDTMHAREPEANRKPEPPKE